jgi:hypothetical protein
MCYKSETREQGVFRPYARNKLDAVQLLRNLDVVRRRSDLGDGVRSTTIYLIRTSPKLIVRLPECAGSLRAPSISPGDFIGSGCAATMPCKSEHRLGNLLD